ncbi:GNAT family N-acetyltransferase [Acidihalobacter prosperus]|uniref:GNAT family N-acetyltransferase n=1 Tax=Acidihalobacter prosperus TaxID=160660 RepID=A0A1A6C8Z1_9GAMM|nr:GNAT family N-acetyltransferase [Acidihalobacter prosperus]OBS11015.1 GNAT family N-acetyltransferase [Acidihalobacter prosperus]
MDASVKPVIRVADWQAEREILYRLRETVFVHEQGVPAALEIDEFDPRSLHLLAEYAGQPVGTGRLLEDGHIGRLAVLREYRGRGIGKALLDALVREAVRRDFAEAVLSAQLHAIPFYERAGFAVCGPEFLDAGIVHREMRRPLKNA